MSLLFPHFLSCRLLSHRSIHSCVKPQHFDLGSEKFAQRVAYTCETLSLEHMLGTAPSLSHPSHLDLWCDLDNLHFAVLIKADGRFESAMSKQFSIVSWFWEHCFLTVAYLNQNISNEGPSAPRWQIVEHGQQLSLLYKFIIKTQDTYRYIDGTSIFQYISVPPPPELKRRLRFRSFELDFPRKSWSAGIVRQDWKCPFEIWLYLGSKPMSLLFVDWQMLNWDQTWDPWKLYLTGRFRKFLHKRLGIQRFSPWKLPAGHLCQCRSTRAAGKF